MTRLFYTIRIWLSTVIDPEMTFAKRRLIAREQGHWIAHDMDRSL